MGQKRVLTDSEKSKMTKNLEITEILGRDHRTIKCFVTNSQQGRKTCIEKKKTQINCQGFEKNQA